MVVKCVPLKNIEWSLKYRYCDRYWLTRLGTKYFAYSEKLTLLANVQAGLFNQFCMFEQTVKITNNDVCAVVYIYLWILTTLSRVGDSLAIIYDK